MLFVTLSAGWRLGIEITHVHPQIMPDDLESEAKNDRQRVTECSFFTEQEKEQAEDEY